MTELKISINGRNFVGFDGIQLISQIDSITSALTFGSFLRLGTLVYQRIEARRDGVLIFTGELTDYDIDFDDNGFGETPPKPNTYTAYSLPYILEDCSIPLEIYPLQTESSTLKDVVLKVCNHYGITLVIDKSALDVANTILKTVDSNPEDTCKSFIDSICSQNGLILSHNEKGNLIITKKIVGKDRKYPTPTKSSYKVRGRGLYRKHVGLGQQGIKNNTPIQSENITESIKRDRNITKVQSKGDNDTIESFTFGIKVDTFKAIGVNETYNNFFPHLGDIKDINGLGYLVNNFTYSFNSKSETCSLTRYRSIVYER
jgi:hypothetical protein